ncbi:MAG: type II secretion system secretin GspD [Geobacteraceae bacterium]|nr:type II secretion system secretin GspD [Geobacteraceae bacterium]
MAVLLAIILFLPIVGYGKGIVLNFNDVDISTMAKFISDLTGKNIVMDDRVKGKISVFSPAKLTVDEAFGVFTSVLELKGFTVVKAGRVYKIVPTSVARQAGIKLITGSERTPVNELYVARLIRLERISAAETAAFLQPVVSKDGHIAPFGPANMLLVVDSSLNIQKILDIIKSIDVPPPSTNSKVNVCYLENADSIEVAKVLDGMIKGNSANAALTGSSQQSALEGGKVSITSDKATNSLVIMASPTDYQNLLQVIRKLDRRRKQVFVQALIAEISIDKLREIGTQIGVSGAGTDGSVAAAGVFDAFGFLGATASAQQSAVVEALQGLAKNVNISAVLKLLDQNDALNVLSTPNIMTSDNKEAEIFVGENVPFLTQTNLTSTGLSQQSIERKDTGITLRITPQITEGEYIKLDIYQEISAVKNAVFKGAAADITTTKRSAKTSVVVKDAETVVIGGLIQNRDEETVNKIPLLGDIPILGYLFKTKSKTRQKTSLMILLTPRIVRDAADMARVSEQQKRKFENEVAGDSAVNLDKELKGPDDSRQPKQ